MANQKTSSMRGSFGVIGAIGMALLGAAALSATFIGCAGTEDGDGMHGDAGQTTLPPPPPADPILDAAADGDAAGCDAGDPNCVTQTAPCDTTAWCPAPTGVDTRFSLTAVWGSSATDVWVVGAAGTNMRWDGTKWTVNPSITPYTLRAVAGTGPEDVWAVSTFDTIYRYAPSDGGPPSWQKAPAIVSGPQYISSLARSAWANGTEVVVAGDSVRVGVGVNQRFYQEWLSQSGAVGWTGLPGVDGLNIYGVWGNSAGTLWAVGFSTKRGGIAYRRAATSPDGGVPGWVETDIQETDPLSAVWGSSATDVWTVGGRGLIRHYAGTGDTWDIVESPTSSNLRSIWGSGPNDVWAVGDSGTLLHWNGTKWTPTTAAFALGLKPNLYGVWGSSASDVWAVGEDGVVLHFTGRIPEEQQQ